jgi:CheY-like chemotaxis protein
MATILIVDDNPANLRLLCFLLATQGHDVQAAEDANEALAVLEDFDACLLLLDIQLPGMDGLALTRLLREDPKHRDRLIIAVTASAMKGDEEKAMKAGCDGYITKPIDTRTLPKVVASYLERASVARAPHQK